MNLTKDILIQNTEKYIEQLEEDALKQLYGTITKDILNSSKNGYYQYELAITYHQINRGKLYKLWYNKGTDYIVEMVKTVFPDLKISDREDEVSNLLVITISWG